MTTTYPTRQEALGILQHACGFNDKLVFRSIISPQEVGIIVREGESIWFEPQALPNWTYQFASVVDIITAGRDKLYSVYSLKMNSGEIKHVLLRDIVAVEDDAQPLTTLGSLPETGLLLLQEPTAENP